MTTTNISLHITGMSCRHCEKAVGDKIKSLKGISAVNIDLPNGTATVSYDSAKVSSEDIINAINSMETYKAHA